MAPCLLRVLRNSLAYSDLQVDVAQGREFLDDKYIPVSRRPKRLAPLENFFNFSVKSLTLYV